MLFIELVVDKKKKKKNSGVQRVSNNLEVKYVGEVRQAISKTIY